MMLRRDPAVQVPLLSELPPLQPHWLSILSCNTKCDGAHSQRILEAHRELAAHLALLLQLLLVRPAGHVGIAVGPRILPQLIHEEAVEEVALGTKACLAPLAVSHLFRHHSFIVKSSLPEPYLSCRGAHMDR